MSVFRNLAVAGAALVGLAGTSAQAATLTVDASHGVAIDFSILTADYYRFSFGSLPFSITDLDVGEGYRLSVYDANGDLWAEAPDSDFTTPVFDPPKSLGGVGVVTVRATLTALGLSSFGFDDAYSVTNIFAQLSDPALEGIPGGGRRTGNRPSTGVISGFEIEQTPPDPDPTPTGVPEPGAWALLILGFGGAGAALRARRRLPV